MVGVFIRWDKLFEGSPSQDGKEVAERGAFAPVVEYDDQTHAFGLPGLITEPWQAMKRWLGGGAEENVARMRTGLPFTPEAVGDALTVAGSAALGSVAAPKPAGAYVTSGAPMKPTHLPMDEASRMARAKEMGFDLPMYHSTGADFSEFKPSYRGASFFADTPEAASRGSSYGSQDWYGMRDSRSESIMPVMLRSQYIKGLNLAPKEIEWWNALPAVTDEAGLDAAMKSKPFHNIDYWWRVFDEVQNPDGSYSYVKKGIPSKTLEDVRATGENVYGSKYIGSYEGEQGASRLAKEQGMDGFILEDEAGLSVGIVDPTRIRSKFAAFDPAKADSADLLAANPKEAAALNAAIQGERDDKLIDIVKKYGIAGAASLYGLTQGEVEQALAEQGQGAFIVAPEPMMEE